MSKITASSLALLLAEKFAHPQNRTFFALVNGIPGFLALGVDAEVLKPLALECEERGRLEVPLPEQSIREILLLTNSRVQAGNQKLEEWMDLTKASAQSSSSQIKKDLPKERAVFSKWAYLVTHNWDSASPQWRQWVEAWSDVVAFDKNWIYECSHDVLSLLQLSKRREYPQEELKKKAREFSQQLLKLRQADEFWEAGGDRLELTLRIAANLLIANLLHAQTVEVADLEKTIAWLRHRLDTLIQDDASLNLRTLGLGVELLALVEGHTNIEPSILKSVQRLLFTAALPLLDMRAGRLAESVAQVQANTVFYITSFEKEYNSVRQVVEEEVGKRGFQVLKTEKAPLSRFQDLPSRWRKGIEQAMVVVADVTGDQRPNVPLELGYALGLGKYVIVLFNSNKDPKEHKKFMSDLAHIFYVHYQTSDPTFEKLRDELGAELDIVQEAVTQSRIE